MIGNPYRYIYIYISQRHVQYNQRLFPHENPLNTTEISNTQQKV